MTEKEMTKLANEYVNDALGGNWLPLLAIRGFIMWLKTKGIFRKDIN